MEQFCLGVDIGNVIIDHNIIDNTLKEKKYSAIPEVKDALQALIYLKKYKFGKNIHLVSKCTPWAQEKILSWLSENNFYGKTGIEYQNVHFCNERIQKAEICRKYKITHFIDDRLEVLSYLINVVPKLYLFNAQEQEILSFFENLPEVTVVRNWNELVNKIIHAN